MKILFRSSFLISFSLFTAHCSAQADTACPPPDDKKAVELYNQGIDHKKYQKEQRLDFLNQALQLEPDYTAANFAMGEEYAKTALAEYTPLDPAIPYFLKVIQQCPHFHSDPYYFVGSYYFESGKNADAVVYLQKFLAFKDDDIKKYAKNYDEEVYLAKQKLKVAKFYVDIYSHPVPYDPHPVKDLDTPYNEYLATISPDNQYAYFTRVLPVTDMNSSLSPENNMKEFFMWAKRQPDDNFDPGTPMPKPFNSNENEGGPSITIDDKHLYFTICKRTAGPELSCQIYYSDYEYGRWMDIQSMGAQVDDPSSWNSQPSISSDGYSMYFASDRAGGFGKTDIYVTNKDPQTGEWGPPINLGDSINTSGNEKTPFIHTDSHTLYFSSDGRLGLGGYDIYYARMDSAGKWKEPVNIGYPINSPGDDLGFFVSTDGKTAYFCSNDSSHTHSRGPGGYDIFEFDLYKEARPEKVALIKGDIKDTNGVKLTGATVNIVNAKTHKKVAAISDTVNASYAAVVNLSKPDTFIVTINKKGYAFNSGIVTAKDSFSGKPLKMDFNLKEIVKGSNYTLHDIYYKTNSYRLEPISLVVVKEFAQFMMANPTIKVKIAGYTDNVGTNEANLALSSNRAHTVEQELENEGISAERLSYQGYGDSNPLASNETEEGRAKNRRTEFIITQN